MQKLSNIQILRAIAALTVVIYHVGIEATSVCTGTGRSCSYEFMFGVNGVALFFMISGFIMVTTSWSAFAAPGGASDFMRRRITRIVPLYWLVTSLAVVGAMGVFKPDGALPSIPMNFWAMRPTASNSSTLLRCAVSADCG
jgi:exopolysaccharide production protein ExoZ